MKEKNKTLISVGLLIIGIVLLSIWNNFYLNKKLGQAGLSPVPTSSDASSSMEKMIENLSRNEISSEDKKVKAIFPFGWVQVDSSQLAKGLNQKQRDQYKIKIDLAAMKPFSKADLSQFLATEMDISKDEPSFKNILDITEKINKENNINFECLEQKEEADGFLFKAKYINNGNIFYSIEKIFAGPEEGSLRKMYSASILVPEAYWQEAMQKESEDVIRSVQISK